METQLNRLFQEWQRLGASVLVAQSERIAHRAVESLIAESTAYCRHSGRLTWIVLDWLLTSASPVSVPLLLAETRTHGDLAVLGLIASAARAQAADSIFELIERGCVPNLQPDFFFYRVKNSGLASRLTMENLLPVFQKWNFWCNELRYLNQRATG